MTKEIEDQLYWNRFEKIHCFDTVELVKSLKGSTISEEDFVKKFKALEGSNRSPKNAKKMYRFLVKYGVFYEPVLKK